MTKTDNYLVTAEWTNGAPRGVDGRELDEWTLWVNGPVVAESVEAAEAQATAEINAAIERLELSGDVIWASLCVTAAGGDNGGTK